MILEEGSRLFSATPAPIVNVEPNGYLQMVLEIGSGISTIGNPTFNVDGYLQVQVLDFTSIDPDSFSGSGQIQIENDSANSSISENHPSFTGNLDVELAVRARLINYDNTISGLNAENVQEAIDLLDGYINLLSAQYTSFVYRPGGTQNENVFNNWSDLYNAILQTEGERIIEVDDSISSPAIIPAGFYDLRGITLQGSFRENVITTTLSLDNGVVFDNLKKIRNFLTIISNSNSPIITISSVTDFIYIDNGVDLVANGGFPFISVLGGNTLSITLDRTSGFTTGTQPILDVMLGAACGVFAYSNCFIQNNTLSGDGFVSISIINPSGIFSNSQVAFGGTLSVTLANDSSLLEYDPSLSTLTATNVQDAIDELDGYVASIASDVWLLDNNTNGIQRSIGTMMLLIL
ncbi:MAG: hypothetical protein HC877_23425 [Thioploca sp.]|nr:hypothetical protein [Thioploca sp.]